MKLYFRHFTIGTLLFLPIFLGIIHPVKSIASENFPSESIKQSKDFSQEILETDGFEEVVTADILNEAEASEVLIDESAEALEEENSQRIPLRCRIFPSASMTQ
ncbi:MAG: hypothetical protein ACFBSC_11720 [Microcoleaceae cyanobacterium]